MKRNRLITFSTAIVALLGLMSVTVADLLEPQASEDTTLAAPQEEEDVTNDQDAGEDDTAPMLRPPPRPSERRARSLRLDEDGFIVGYVNYVDPYTLDLEPVPDAVVTFMQNLEVIVQTKTGSDGRFAVKGLIAHTAVSVFVRSPEWVCMFGTFIEGYKSDEPVDIAAANNQLVFGVQWDLIEHAAGDAKYQVIQCVPYEDFISAFRQGLFGDLCAGVTDYAVSVAGPRGNMEKGYVGGAYAAAAALAAIGGIAAYEEDVKTPFDP
jgi:hypothetical protein